MDVAHVNHQDKWGKTALSLAINADCVEITKMIIRYLFETDIQGVKDALCQALEKGHDKVVLALVQDEIFDATWDWVPGIVEQVKKMIDVLESSKEAEPKDIQRVQVLQKIIDIIEQKKSNNKN